MFFNKGSFRHKIVCLTIKKKIMIFYKNIINLYDNHKRNKIGHIHIYQKHDFNQHALLNYSLIQTLILLKFWDLMLLHGM